MSIYFLTHSRTSLIISTTQPYLLPLVLPISTYLDTKFSTHTSQDAETISDTASNPVELKQHPDLWFEDESLATIGTMLPSNIAVHSVLEFC
jgi:hypothetical protein